MSAWLVELGKVPKGVALLDEAMAASLGGEGGSLNTVVYTSCHTIISCSRAAEFERAARVRAIDQFSGRNGCPFLYTMCRTLYGTILFATGQWPRAEGCTRHRPVRALRRLRHPHAPPARISRGSPPPAPSPWRACARSSSPCVGGVGPAPRCRPGSRAPASPGPPDGTSAAPCRNRSCRTGRKRLWKTAMVWKSGRAMAVRHMKLTSWQQAHCSRRDE